MSTRYHDRVLVDISKLASYGVVSNYYFVLAKAGHTVSSSLYSPTISRRGFSLSNSFIDSRDWMGQEEAGLLTALSARIVPLTLPCFLFPKSSLPDPRQQRSQMRSLSIGLLDLQKDPSRGASWGQNMRCCSPSRRLNFSREMPFALVPWPQYIRSALPSL